LSTSTGSILFREKKIHHFFSSQAKKENIISRSIGVITEEFELVIGSDITNWEDYFPVVADA